MIVDVHQHAFWHSHDDEAVVRNMDEHGIGLTWLLTWEGWADEVDERTYAGALDPRGDHVWLPLQGVVEAHRRYPDRFIPGYCPNPRDPYAPQKLESAVSLFGIKTCGEWKFRLPFDDPRCIALFWKAGELGLPVTLHLDVPFLPPATGRDLQPYWYGGTVANLERTLQQCPDTIFIGHAQHFWAEISADVTAEDFSTYPKGPIRKEGAIVRLLSEYPNLHADISAGSGMNALTRDSEYGYRFLDQFQDKLYFGTDLCRYQQELPIIDYLKDALKEGRIAQQVYDKIAFKNAKRLLGL